MALNFKEIVAGLLFCFIGLFFSITAWLTLPIGQAFSMGPGYFPLILGLILTALGMAIVAVGAKKPIAGLGSIGWRGALLVMLSIVFFGATIRGLGFGPSLFVTLLLSSAASGLLAWKSALILSSLLTIFCVGIFIYALGLPYPLIGRWITG